jgi:hypothetical protein
MRQKIFGLGLSRTGTTTLNHYLNDLGIKTVHYPLNKNELFSKDNDGATDIPVINYLEELDKTFPNSKFILTTRNMEEWLNSIVNYFERKRKRNYNDWQKTNRIKVYGSLFPNREQCEKVFVEHEKRILNYFKSRPQDLLILNICNGDDPQILYDFLGVEKKSNGSFERFNELKK